MPLLGREEVRRIRIDLDNASKVLAADIAKRMRVALAPLKTEVPAEALARMPHRGGYAPLLARATKVFVRVSSEPSATIRIEAKGKKDMRDVKSLNLGILRHPTFGRRGKGDWHAQKVRSGFVDDPLDAATKRVGEGIETALDDLTTYLSKG